MKPRFDFEMDELRKVEKFQIIGAAIRNERKQKEKLVQGTSKLTVEDDRKRAWTKGLTRTSAIVKGLRDALCQLKSCQLVHSRSGDIVVPSKI